MSQASSDEVEKLDVTIIQTQQARYRTSLEFWQRREQQPGQSHRSKSLTDNPTDAQSADLTAPRVGHRLPFKEGDVVVHIRHGRSRYGGIRLLDADGITKEYLQLEYAGGDRIYVPIEHLERVQKHERKSKRSPVQVESKLRGAANYNPPADGVRSGNTVDRVKDPTKSRRSSAGAPARHK